MESGLVSCTSALDFVVSPLTEDQSAFWVLICILVSLRILASVCMAHPPAYFHYYFPYCARLPSALLRVTSPAHLPISQSTASSSLG